MKHFLSLAVTLSLILSLSITALADEVLFRGTPWFGTYEETIDALEEEVISWDLPIASYGSNVINEIEGHSYGNNYQDICTVSSNSLSMKVAGYAVNSVKLYFAYTPNEKGKIDHINKNTSFYMARYNLSVDDRSMATDDLKEKLSGIYGAFTTHTVDEGCDGTSTYYRWDGDYSSFVALTPADSGLYIYYGNLQGTDMIKKAEAIQKEEEALALKNAGSDGL